MPRRPASGTASASSSRWRRFHWFCTLTKRAPPAAAASASRSWAALKFEQPISRTLPARTSSSRTPRVSAMGVDSSGRCSW